MVYLFVNADDSKRLHSFNTLTDFVVELPNDIDVSKHELGLSEWIITGYKGPIYIYCDLLDSEDIVVHGKHLPLLRYIPKPLKGEIKRGEIQNIYWMKTSAGQSSVKRFRIYLTTSNQQPLEEIPDTVNTRQSADARVELVLRFKKVHK